MTIRGVFSSDFHLGLKTDDVPRTEEIVQVMLQVAKRAKKIKADFVVFGGDIFDHNDPSEYLISCFIRVLNVLKRAEIKTFVMPGNHDVIAANGRRSCLEFLKRMKSGYENIELIEDIKTIRFAKTEVGALHLTFLPFLCKSHIPAPYKSVQEYVDYKCKAIQREMKWQDRHIVFSHLGVPGAVPGAEEGMLRKVEVTVPEIFLGKIDVKRGTPTVIQAHYHSADTKGNIEIVGSPIFCGFGEQGTSKRFLQINIAANMEEKTELKYIRTISKRFVEFEISKPETFISNASPKEAAKSIRVMLKGQGVIPAETVLKLSIAVPEAQAGYDFEAVRAQLAKSFAQVLTIKPRIIRSQTKRNKKQTLRLIPRVAVELWLKTNKHKRSNALQRLAEEFMS